MAVVKGFRYNKFVLKYKVWVDENNRKDTYMY